MQFPFLLLFLLNIFFVGAVWHMDINHNLELSGQKNRGIFKITPDRGYRISQKILLLILILIDVLFVLTFLK